VNVLFEVRRILNSTKILEFIVICVYDCRLLYFQIDRCLLVSYLQWTPELFQVDYYLFPIFVVPRVVILNKLLIHLVISNTK